MLIVHCYGGGFRNAEKVECADVSLEDAEFFEQNNIKVSLEFLNEEYILYACPYEDDSEESEIIFFVEDKTCKESLSTLVEMCKEKFENNWSQWRKT
jgi:hypothetical protein